MTPQSARKHDRDRGGCAETRLSRRRLLQQTSLLRLTHSSAFFPARAVPWRWRSATASVEMPALSKPEHWGARTVGKGGGGQCSSGQPLQFGST
ncbi:hypothetical protein HPB50_016536 [Hyalomma asiaticum]|uniref:Uncharacterized protein n=1 Tax=Hyalomma asiaticum TaxID=266040 RepID=A0ACB7T1D4_HYAAI|nr:hypothetical protein HPB50_016536 [Hyalomma asiaticum]